MELMASLAPARAEIEAGVVAKADQKQSLFINIILNIIDITDANV